MGSIMLVNDVRHLFAVKMQRKDPIKAGTIDINGLSFTADEDHIFGTPNKEYIKAEIEWYESQSRFVDRLFKYYGKEVKIWKDISSRKGKINSNYGWMIHSKDNGFQYLSVLKELVNNPDSRRASMIYQRPSMHYDWNDEGMCDFTCTNAVSYFINGKWLDVVVQMRSNDAVFGFNNDYAWQRHVQKKLLEEINEERKWKDLDSLELGTITWQSQSFHIYERHFKLLEDWMERNGY